MRELVVGIPRRIGKVVVIPLIHERRRRMSAGRGFWVQGESTPAAVVVKSGSALRVFSIDGEEQDVNDVAAMFPALAALLVSAEE